MTSCKFGTISNFELTFFRFQHAGRQRGAPAHQTRKAEQEEDDRPGPSTRRRQKSESVENDQKMESPARMASLSPLNSPSIPDTPTTTDRSPSPIKTPTPVKRKSLLKNVTVRRTAKRNSSVSVYNAAPTPVLNRSKHGRVIKPRLAPGERIVYDCYGSPIEARKDITRTHISNNSSIEFVS